MCDLNENDFREKLQLPFIYQDDYDKLSTKEKNKLTYSNPCITNTPNVLRVGQVFDSDLGYWRDARKSDF